METGLFPGYRGERRNLRMATPVVLAHKVWHHIGTCLSKRRIHLCAIWDAFAGLGVDAVVASKTLQTCVFATEKDRHTYTLLRDNIDRNQANVVARCADAFQGAFRVDLVYLDPPWGSAFCPTEAFDFFGKFQDLLVFMQSWGRFVVVKTPLILGPTRPPWKPVYAYRSEKYRIIVWLFDLSALYQTRSVGPLEPIDKHNGTDEHGQGDPNIGQMTAE